MALTLTGEIDDSQRDVAITGTVPDAIEPGYLFRFSDGDEVMRLVGFARVKATHGWPVNPNGWIVNRGQLNTEATAHDADSTVQAIVDEFVASEDEDAPDPIDSGGGPGTTPTLAQTLAQGNDTGGLGIVSDATGSDDAVVSTTATSVDGTASAITTAAAMGTGSADAHTSAGGGSGYADASAVASLTGDGYASVDRTASAATGSASASSQAQVDVAVGSVVATSDGTEATASLFVIAAGGSASIGPVADATSALIKVTGVPTSDPGVAGALYTAAGVLMVSAG